MLRYALVSSTAQTYALQKTTPRTGTVRLLEKDLEATRDTPDGRRAAGTRGRSTPAQAAGTDAPHARRSASRARAAAHRKQRHELEDSDV